MILPAIAVAVLRLYFCFRTPVSTGDILRHIFTALYVRERGLGAAGIPLAVLNPGLANISFAQLPYNYPPVTLAFFVAVSYVSATVFAAKLALTLIEAVNAYLVTRITRSSWLGVVYFALPTSIWFVSGEGQFEPLQNLFVFGAILAARKERFGWAFALLALGIQVKLSAVLLVPWLLWRVYKTNGTAVDALGGFALGMLPTLVAGFFYPVLESIGGTAGSFYFNPFYWNFADARYFRWMPTWMIAVYAVTTCAAILSLLVAQVRTVKPMPYLAPIAFLAALRFSALAQFWYVLILPSFLVAIDDERVQRWSFALLPLLDVYSLLMLIVGPFGFTMGDYWSGITAFTRFRVGL